MSSSRTRIWWYPIFKSSLENTFAPFSWCKARYAVLFRIRTFPPEPEDEAHIGPTATYDDVIYPGFQHDITALHIQAYNISYNRHTKRLNTLQQRKIYV